MAMVEPQERYPFTCSCGEYIQAVGRPSQEEIDCFTDELVKYVFEGKDTIGIEEQIISEEAKLMLNALRGNFKTFNDYEGDDHLALQLMEYNLFEFSASKTESRLSSMKELLIDPNTKQPRDFASFRVECDKVMEKYNKYWLETEYNLSIAVGPTKEKVEYIDNVPVYYKERFTYPEDYKGIPLIPIDAMACFGNGEFQIMNYETSMYRVPKFEELNTDFMIKVKGSSMYPKYSSGDTVACKKLNLSNIFFQWNKVYVLDTEQGALIKRIKLLVSENPNYEPFELHLSQVYAVAIVIGVIRME